MVRGDLEVATKDDSSEQILTKKDTKAWDRQLLSKRQNASKHPSIASLKKWLARPM